MEAAGFRGRPQSTQPLHMSLGSSPGLCLHDWPSDRFGLNGSGCDTKTSKRESRSGMPTCERPETMVGTPSGSRMSPRVTSPSALSPGSVWASSMPSGAAPLSVLAITRGSK